MLNQRIDTKKWADINKRDRSLHTLECKEAVVKLSGHDSLALISRE